MGRPRKQPRRIVTFNLNVPTADRIDDLGISNRSEWANRVFTAYLDNRDNNTEQATRQRINRAVEEAENDLLNSLSDDPRRLAVMLINSLDQDTFNTKLKGRYTIGEQLMFLTKELQ